MPEREKLPNRRAQFTQKVKIADGNGNLQTFYASFGEYADGRLGEIWLEASKENTFLRGVLSTLARSISTSIQCGTSLEEIVHSLRSLEFPPNGTVTGSEDLPEHLQGSPFVKTCTSVADWVAQEIEHAYILKTPMPEVPPTPPPPKVFGATATDMAKMKGYYDLLQVRYESMAHI